MSNATVIPLAFATNQPGISCDDISTSSDVKIMLFPEITSDNVPLASNSLICSGDNDCISLEIKFISFPKRGPSALKLGLICFTKTPDVSSKS